MLYSAQQASFNPQSKHFRAATTTRSFYLRLIVSPKGRTLFAKWRSQEQPAWVSSVRRAPCKNHRCERRGWLYSLLRRRVKCKIDWHPAHKNGKFTPPAQLARLIGNAPFLLRKFLSPNLLRYKMNHDEQFGALSRGSQLAWSGHGKHFLLHLLRQSW